VADLGPPGPKSGNESQNKKYETKG